MNDTSTMSPSSIFGHVKNEQVLREHPTDATVRGLPGKKVQIFPETATYIKGAGIRVNIMPVDLSLPEPTSLMINFLHLDAHTEEAIKRAARSRGGA